MLDKTSILARWERCLRPYLSRLPARLAVRLYSRGRRRFLAQLSREAPRASKCPEELARTLWGLRFASPILNAAGMFKNGDGYALAERQGAGAFLVGTTTHLPRAGNRRFGTAMPFAPYPRSGAASNWLGLPNPGHHAVAAKLSALERRADFPLGASLAAVAEDAPDEEERLRHWANGLRLFEQAGVDFLEINESCPNTDEGKKSTEELRARLTFLRDSFLRRRRRRLPVLVKFSCDTAITQVPSLIALIAELGFDGVNFGNTSIDYPGLRPSITASEKPLFDHFVKLYGGGVSGRPLKERSLALAKTAVEYLRENPPGHEFHVVRTGGIENVRDLLLSEEAGISLNQWYSGYFEAFGRYGHRVYQELYRFWRS